MTTCTWKGCEDEATVGCYSKTGERWAHLCGQHEIKLDAAILSGNPRRIMSCYIKAQGGAEAAAKRVFPAQQSE